MELCSLRLSSFENKAHYPRLLIPLRNIRFLSHQSSQLTSVSSPVRVYRYCGKTTRAQQKYGFGARPLLFFSLLWRYYLLGYLLHLGLICAVWVSVQMRFEQKPGVSSIGGRIDCRQLLITEWTGADSTWFCFFCCFFFIVFSSSGFYSLLPYVSTFVMLRMVNKMSNETETNLNYDDVGDLVE